MSDQAEAHLSRQEIAYRQAEQRVSGRRRLTALAYLLMSFVGFVGLEFIVVNVADVVWRMVLAAVTAGVAGFGLAGWGRFLGTLQVTYHWRDSLNKPSP